MHWSLQVIRDHKFAHLLVYMEKINFCGSLCGLLEYFREIFWDTIVMKTFTKWFLSNVKNHGESDVQWQISI